MRFNKDGDVTFQLDKILNGGIEFSDNVRGGFVEFTTTGAEQQINHGLGYTPIGWIEIYRDGEVEIHAGSTAWTSESLYLVSSAASVVVRLFVM